MGTDEFWDDAERHLVRYGASFTPRIIESAAGAYVRDSTGAAILDFTSGQMSSILGHSHPDVVRTVIESVSTLDHLYSGMLSRPVVDLARRLTTTLPESLSKVLLLTTGAESNEAALKMAKLATGGWEVLALGGSWHGVTGGAGAVSFASDRRGTGPKPAGVHVIPEPNAYRCPVDHCRDKCDMTCLRVGLRLFDMQSSGAPAAIIAEPVISAGGVLIPPEGYFDELRKACDARGMLLIFDEAQTAFGRLGVKFAADKVGVVPDIMSVSKTLGGGVPLAATITSDEIEEKAFKAGFSFYTSHVSDPLPAAVGFAVLETIERENLLERAIEMGDYLRAQLEALQQRYEVIGDVRGDGLLLGVELVKDREKREPHHKLGANTTPRCYELGLSMNIRRRPERGSVWRIAPPLTVTKDELDRGVAILDQSLRDSLDQVART